MMICENCKDSDAPSWELLAGIYIYVFITSISGEHIITDITRSAFKKRRG